MAANDILVKIGADISQFSRAMADSQKQLANFSKANKDTFGAFSRIGDKLTKGITVPALAATSALTGITLVKGFNRLIGIDTARAKLTALGHDAESVETIMDNALEAVKGTSYGMDEAATTAANAVAAGVTVGKELTDYLTLTGDAAAIAGTSMSEMGSIINKVTTAGKAYNGELQMLSDRGLPIYQWLADEAGTTADAIFDMASQGEVSTEMFLKAIENNIGGAAKVMGEESFAAALKNIGSDIARIGANFLDAGGDGKGFFSTLKPLLTEFRGYLESVEDAAADLGTKFGESFINMIETVRELKAAWDDLSPVVQDFVKIAATFGSIFLVAIGPILKLVGFLPLLVDGFKDLKKILAAVFSTTGLIIMGIVALIAGLVWAYENIEWFRDMVDAAWQWIKEVTIIVFDAIKSAIQTALEFIMALWETHGESIIETASIIWQTISDVIGEIVSFIREIVEKVLAEIDAFWTEHGEFIIKTASEAWEGIKIIVSTVSGVIKEIIDGVLGVIKGIFEVVWSIISGIVKIAWENMKTTVSTFIDIIAGIIDAVMKVIQGDWEGAWKAIMGIAEDIWNNIESFFASVDLVQIGKDIINGLISGISSMGSAVWDAVKGIGSNIKDGFTSFFSIRSPSRLMMSLAKHIPGGAIKGIDSMTGKVRKATERLSEAMTPDTKSISMDYATPNGLASTLSSAVNGTVDINSSDSALVNAIGSLERRLGDLEVVMDGERVGRIVTPHVNEGNAVDANVRRYFD